MALSNHSLCCNNLCIFAAALELPDGRLHRYLRGTVFLLAVATCAVLPYLNVGNLVCAIRQVCLAVCHASHGAQSLSDGSNYCDCGEHGCRAMKSKEERDAEDKHEAGTYAARNLLPPAQRNSTLSVYMYMCFCLFVCVCLCVCVCVCVCVCLSLFDVVRVDVVAEHNGAVVR